MVTIAQWWSNSDFYIYIKDEDLKQLGKENVIVVMNHKYDIDWLLGMFLDEISIKIELKRLWGEHFFHNIYLGWILCQRVNLLAVISRFFLLIILLKESY